ncbi:MAG: GGDEF domain-containing protein, partial [Candidatus Eremiobacteraeota bacterium]|nr:GGDEF domain-containing protein [Candidatus Eremiobacteraeota bacterium]
AAGDELLRKLAEILRAQARGHEDLVARNGGDEFCLVWVDCEKSTAIERAEALRARIAAAFEGEAIAITASIGVAAYPFDAITTEELLEAADARMYEAKRAGRDRIAWSVAGKERPGASSNSSGWR